MFLAFINAITFSTFDTISIFDVGEYTTPGSDSPAVTQKVALIVYINLQ
jgi:hypothetical protein